MASRLTLLLMLFQFFEPVLHHNDLPRILTLFGGSQHREALAVARNVVIGNARRAWQPRALKENRRLAAENPGWSVTSTAITRLPER